MRAHRRSSTACVFSSINGGISIIRLLRYGKCVEGTHRTARDVTSITANTNKAFDVVLLN